MNDGQIISQEELATAEAVGVAEVLDLCLRIIAQDAGILAASVCLVAEQSPEAQPEYTQQLADMAVQLAEKVNRMVMDTSRPMLGPVVLRDALVSCARKGHGPH